MKTILSVVIIILFSTFCRAETFTVDSTADNSVKFFASSTFGGFTGVNDDIRGSLTWTEGQPLSEASVYFEVELKTLDTGIGLRNTHMREKYLETEKYPKAIYQGEIREVQEKQAGTYQISSEGTLTIHGVKKSFPIKASLFKTASGYRVVTDFRLDITEFEIKKPGFLLASMDTSVRLRLVFFLVSQTGADETIGDQ